ncbi:Retrovirus-related Pol polyprotein from transposon RE2, partial [Bienertia sinuspersici]
MQLVSVKFNGEGFADLKRAMLLTLSAKNKLGFVNGTVTKPTDPTSAEFFAWERCNALVYALEQKLAQITQVEKKKYSDNLSHKVLKPPAYNSASKPYSTYNSGKQQQHSNSSFPSKTYTASKKPYYFCTHYKVLGHSVERCFQLNEYPLGFKGFKERKVAAMADNQFMGPDTSSSSPVPSSSPNIILEKYNYLVDLLQKQNTHAHSGEQFETSDSSSHALVAGKCCFVSCHNTRWILDSGATDHICTNLDLFTDYKIRSDAQDYITIPDGTRAKIHHIGSIKLAIGLVLQHVLHVPAFKFNLISVHKLCEDLQCELHLSHTKCFLHFQKGYSILLGKVSAGLYTVDTSSSMNALANNVVDS